MARPKRLAAMLSPASRSTLMHPFSRRTRELLAEALRAIARCDWREAEILLSRAEQELHELGLESEAMSVRLAIAAMESAECDEDLLYELVENHRVCHSSVGCLP